MGWEVSIIKDGCVVCDTQFEGCNCIGIHRFVNQIEKCSAAGAIILNHTILCLELKVKDEQKCKVENIIIIPTWELDRDRQVKTRY
jgi:hypothetical protein